MPIEFAAAAAVAAMLNNSISAVDKIYNWVKEMRGERPASVALKSDDKNKVLKYILVGNSENTVRVVLTYEELAARISPADYRHVESFDKRMQLAMRQWEALNARLPLASEVERIRIEANMLDIKDRDICFCLKQVVDFIEKLGIDLQDHYAGARNICGRYD